MFNVWVCSNNKYSINILEVICSFVEFGFRDLEKDFNMFILLLITSTMTAKHSRIVLCPLIQQTHKFLSLVIKKKGDVLVGH